MKKFLSYSGIVCIIIVICSCDNLFEYSPYDTNVPASIINIKNAERISKQANTDDTLRFALLAIHILDTMILKMLFIALISKQTCNSLYVAAILQIADLAGNFYGTKKLLTNANILL